jgi:integrase
MGRKKKPEGRGGDGLFFDDKSGTWGFRVKREDKDTRKKGFKTKTEAKKARSLFLADLENKQEEAPSSPVYTVDAVFTHYLENGAHDKRDATLTRQKSLYKIHFGPAFGARVIDSITAGELSNYLAMLYIRGDGYHRYEKEEENGPAGYSWAYVDGFFKFIFMLWTYARKCGFIDKAIYEDVIVDPATSYSMPKKQDGDEDEGEIITHTQEEIEKMRQRLKTTDCGLAFECGYYLGLRVSECYGLMFSDFDFEKSTVTIQRQLLKMSDSQWSLVPVKTTTAKRTIYVPAPLLELVKAEKEKQAQNKAKYKSGWAGFETVRVRMEKGQDDPLTAGDFINRSSHGDLFTSDTMKGWHRKFKNELGIAFRYHNLRHTHASLCAAHNMPVMELLKRMGHKKISTTQRYYLGKNDIAEEIALQKLHDIFEG